MSSPDARYSTQFSRQQAQEIAGTAAVGAALMLFVGFYFNMEGVSNSSLYNLSVNGFTWMMKVGGGLMGLMAVLLFVGLRPAIFADALLTAVIGGLMVIMGGVWIAFQDYQGILVLLFGGIYISSAWRSWQAFRGVHVGYAYPAAPPIDTATVLPVEPVDPVARQAAMDRLLASKKRDDAAEPPPVREVEPAPAPPPVAKAAKAANPAKPPAKVPPLAKDEPPPDGFLAQLGRDDS